jgi:hypothetical protein
MMAEPVRPIVRRRPTRGPDCAVAEEHYSDGA